MKEQKITDPREIREDVRSQISRVPDSLRSSSPNQWWLRTYRGLRRIERRSSVYPEDIQTHILGITTTARGLLRDQISEDGATEPETIAHTADNIINHMSRIMAEPFCRTEKPKIKEQRIGIEQIVAKRPDLLSLSTQNNGEKTQSRITVKNPKTNISYSFALPQSENVYYKGGIARLMLNILAGAPSSMIESEIPWNDLDVIAIGDSNSTRQEALALGVDPEGVEMLGQSLDFSEYCLGRDIDHNQALLGKEELIYTNAAFKSAQSGHIELTGMYMPNRALYGTDIFTYKGLALGTPRGLMRLIKPVVEGKALSFSYNPANRHVDASPYFLFLARKWSCKKNFPDLLLRAFELGKRMGQVPESESDPLAILNDMHSRYPLFDINAEMNGLRDVAIWKAGKIIRQADRELTWTFSIPSDMEIPEGELHFPSQTITLDGFKPDSILANQVKEKWEYFKESAKIRTKIALESNMPISERYFLKNRWAGYKNSS